MAFKLLIDHPEFVVIDKPPGVPMHDSELSVTAQLRNQFSHSNWYLCHRLDTGTSGCLCLAKSQRAASIISQQFACGETQKYYLALSAARPKKKQGTVSGDMVNRRSGQYILTRDTQNPAVTQFFSFGVMPGIRGFVVKPLTGKTHQIRVALKSLGSPILGDERYGGTNADRLHLHAWSLSFNFEGQCFTAITPPTSGEFFLQPDVDVWIASLPSPESLKWPSYAKQVPALKQQQ